MGNQPSAVQKTRKTVNHSHVVAVQVDGGSSLSPGKLYPNPEYNPKLVAKLVINRRLAPFYHPLELQEGESIECPICFLNYPKNTNWTRCCEQPICTDCFVQIKRPESDFEPACCPFCVQPHFGIIYTPLTIENRNTRRKSIPHNDPSVLTSDEIRPDWLDRKREMEMEKALEAQRVALRDARRRQIEALSGAGFNFEERVGALRYLNDAEEMMLMEAMRRSVQDSPNQVYGEDGLTEEEREIIARLNLEDQNLVSSVLTSNVSPTDGPTAELATIDSPVDTNGTTDKINDSAVDVSSDVVLDNSTTPPSVL